MPPAVKWTLVISAGLTLVAPFLGMLGTTLGMIEGFSVLEKSSVADMASLSHSISLTLISSAAGFLLAVLSLVVFISVLIYWLCTRENSPPPFPQG